MLIRKQNFNIAWQNCTYSIIFQISNLVWTANDSSKHNNLIKVSVSVQINTEKKKNNMLIRTVHIHSCKFSALCKT